MSKKFLGLLVMGAFLVVSCKNDANKAEEAQEVTEVSADANVYVADVAASVIEWEGSKPTGKHNGTIKIKSGELSLNNGKIEGGKFVIDMTSIEVLDLQGKEKTDLEGHLKGLAKDESADHFFNTTKYPEASFEITSVVTENGVTTVSGNLTMKEITKNVSFPATILVNEGQLTLSTETFSINRTDWKVNYGSKSIFADLGDKFINDNIDLKITLTATK
ncbi:MAG: YceI family protein [Flavobacteriales bacterium]|jgi:polyisoprenoid-binding protein YceI|nr:YceI family protein [Flavobacteriales bacterium]